MAYEEPVVALASTTVAATSSAIVDCRGARTLSVINDTTAVFGTSPTIDVDVKWSHDRTIWGATDGTADTMAQVTAASTKAKAFTCKGPFAKLTYTLGGTAKDEKQTITLTSFGGTDSFKMTFGGQESAAIVRGTNAAASDVKTALEALSTITPNTVTVTGNTDAGPYEVTFDNGTLAGIDVGPITVTSGVGCTGAVAETIKGGPPTVTFSLSTYLS
jgi:hypothetical protein